MVDISCKVLKVAANNDDSLSDLLLTIKYVNQGENDLEDFVVKVIPKN